MTPPLLDLKSVVSCLRCAFRKVAGVCTNVSGFCLCVSCGSSMIQMTSASVFCFNKSNLWWIEHERYCLKLFSIQFANCIWYPGQMWRWRPHWPSRQQQGIWNSVEAGTHRHATWAHMTRDCREHWFLLASAKAARDHKLSKHSSCLRQKSLSWVGANHLGVLNCKATAKTQKAHLNQPFAKFRSGTWR